MARDGTGGARAGAPFDLLLRDGRPWGDGPPTSIGLRDGRIVAVDPGLTGPARRSVALGGAAILPAFIEPHLHLDKVFTQDRGHADGLADAARMAAPALAAPDGLADRVARMLSLLERAGVAVARVQVNIGPGIGLANLETVLAGASAFAGRVDLQIVAFADAAMTPDSPAWVLLDRAVDRGCVALGGGTARRRDPEAFIAGLCATAARRGCQVDLHVDEDAGASCLGLEALLRQTRRLGLEGRVVAAHCCALGRAPADDRARLIEAMATLDLSVVALPMTNLFLQGRDDPAGTGPRGLAPVAELLAGGVRVTCGGDNVQDPYLPYGNGDPQLTLSVMGMAAQLSGPRGRSWLARAMTLHAAHALGLRANDLAPGGPADLIALDDRSGAAVGTAPLPLILNLRRGRMVGGVADAALAEAALADPRKPGAEGEI